MSGRRGKTRVLVTAFGAFPGAPSNPTLAIAAALRRSRRGALRDVEIVVRELPVAYGDAASRLTKLLRDTEPDAVLHLGLAARRRTLSVETRAVNRLSALRVDAARRTPDGPFVAPGARPTLRARWPGAAIAAAMATRASARISIDAGDYVCNQTLYLTLASIDVPAGFVHVPKPRPRRPRHRADLDLPTLAQSTAAVEAAVFALALVARNGSTRFIRAGTSAA